MNSYDIESGWLEIEDFLNISDEVELEVGLEESGYFVCSGSIGSTSSFFQYEVYAKSVIPKFKNSWPYDYIVWVSLGSSSGEIVAVRNFPSLVELLSKLSTTLSLTDTTQGKWD